MKLTGTSRRVGEIAGARVQRTGRGSARVRAYSMLIRQAKREPDFELLQPDTEGLEERDAALLHAIYDGAMRRWITFRWLIEMKLKQPWENLDPRLKGVMLAGVAQLILLERVPPHAIVGEAVEWVKTNIGGGAGALTNAVLRGIDRMIRAEYERGEEPTNPEYRERWTGEPDELPLPDGRAIALIGARLPNDPIESLAIATAHPMRLLRAWLKHMPMREVRALAHHSLMPAPVIINTFHADESAHGPLPETLKPHTAPGHHVFTGARSELVRFLDNRPDVWVQDPASTLAVQSVIDLKPTLIIDACAGLGTKTRQLTAVFPHTAIVATDVDRVRWETLREVFAEHPSTVVVPPADLKLHNGRADLIVLDVPCSNTGVLGRRTEAKYRVSPDRTRELTGIQRQIIADAIPLLAKGGRILYSTCSLDPAENEEIVAWACKWHNLQVLREHRRAPSGVPGDGPEQYSDGSYAALLG